MFFSSPCESHRVTPTRSLSKSVSRYWLVKAESGLRAVPAGGEDSGSPFAFFADFGVRDVRRKLMKEVLPEFLAPMTRTLRSG